MTDSPPLNALIFAALGVAIFIPACLLAAKVLPFDLWKQIVEERNAAAAIVAAAIVLGIAWIVAAAVH